MELSINQTSPSLSTIDRLNKEREEQDEKVASGKRINSAADDAAGLQISSRLTSQINGYQQLSNNAQDQVNINNVQSGQLSSIADGLQRANVLSIQSGSPLSDNNAIQGELDVEMFPTATFYAELDEQLLSKLAVGMSKNLAVNGTIELHGHRQTVTIHTMVTKVSDGHLFVVSVEPLLVKAQEFELVNGINKLAELAKLPSITTTVPVSFALNFTR